MIPLLSQAAMRGPPAGAGGDDVREVHVARFHVVEFQKRGLPHAHLLLWLDDAREARDEVRDYIDCRVVGAHAAFLLLRGPLVVVRVLQHKHLRAVHI